MGRISLLKYEKGSGISSVCSCLCTRGYDKVGERGGRIVMEEVQQEERQEWRLQRRVECNKEKKKKNTRKVKEEEKRQCF